MDFLEKEDTNILLYIQKDLDDKASFQVLFVCINGLAFPVISATLSLGSTSYQSYGFISKTAICRPVLPPDLR